MINIYEQEGIKKDSKQHIKSNVALELEESCSIQFKVDNLRKTLTEANVTFSHKEVLCQKGYAHDNIIEFHADNNPCFQKLVSNYAFQGYLSMR